MIFYHRCQRRILSLRTPGTSNSFNFNLMHLWPKAPVDILAMSMNGCVKILMKESDVHRQSLQWWTTQEKPSLHALLISNKRNRTWLGKSFDWLNLAKNNALHGVQGLRPVPKDSGQSPKKILAPTGGVHSIWLYMLLCFGRIIKPSTRCLCVDTVRVWLLVKHPGNLATLS